MLFRVLNAGGRSVAGSNFEFPACATADRLAADSRKQIPITWLALILEMPKGLSVAKLILGKQLDASTVKIPTVGN